MDTRNSDEYINMEYNGHDDRRSADKPYEENNNRGAMKTYPRRRIIDDEDESSNEAEYSDISSQDKAPISVDSFDKAYERHMRQVHEKLEQSRKIAKNNIPPAQSERAVPPPPPQKTYVQNGFVSTTDDSFLADEASDLVRKTVSSAEWDDNVQRVVIAGSLGVHSIMEETVKDRMAREDNIRENYNDGVNLLGSHIFMKKSSSKKKKKSPSKKKDSGSVIDPKRLMASVEKAYKSIKTRFGFMLLFYIILVYFTLAQAILIPIPNAFLFTENYVVSSVTGLLLMTACAMSSFDLFLSGLSRLANGKPDTDTVISLSALAAFITGFLCLCIPEWRVYPVPFILPASWLFLRMLALKIRLKIKFRSLRLVNRYKVMKTLLLKVNDGYINKPTYTRVPTHNFNEFYKSMRDDELGDNITKPYTLIAAAFAILTALIVAIIPPKGAIDGHFFYALTCLLSMVPSAGLILTSALPYSTVARRMYKAGAAAGGSRSLLYCSREAFVVLSDSDLYPAGNVSITDFKLLTSYDRRLVFKYASSLLTAIGSGLAAPFNKVLRDEFISNVEPSDISFTGEAVSAVIDNHHIIIGDDSAMRRAGFRLTRLPTRTPVYIAIDAELAAVFALSYTSNANTEYSLRLLLKTKRIPVIAARDFNITVDRVEKGFRVSPGFIVCPDIDTRVMLSDPNIEADANGVVFSKPGIRSLAETIEGARRFKRASSLTMLCGLASALIGLILVTLMMSYGWFISATPFNLFIFQLLWFIPSFILSLWSGKY